MRTIIFFIVLCIGQSLIGCKAHHLTIYKQKKYWISGNENVINTPDWDSSNVLMQGSYDYGLYSKGIMINSVNKIIK